jgi:hypothetical protein
MVVLPWSTWAMIAMFLICLLMLFSILSARCGSLL